MPKTGPKLLLLALAGLAGCDVPSENDAAYQALPVRPPAQICSRVADALDKMEKSAAIELVAPGEAVIPQDGWLALGEGGRQQIGQLLAYHAACGAAAPQRETQVTIRNESGQVLSRPVVTTSVTLQDSELD